MEQHHHQTVQDGRESPATDQVLSDPHGFLQGPDEERPDDSPQQALEQEGQEVCGGERRRLVQRSPLGEDMHSQLITEDSEPESSEEGGEE